MAKHRGGSMSTEYFKYDYGDHYEEGDCCEDSDGDYHEEYDGEEGEEGEKENNTATHSTADFDIICAPVQIVRDAEAQAQDQDQDQAQDQGSSSAQAQTQAQAQGSSSAPGEAHATTETCNDTHLTAIRSMMGPTATASDNDKADLALVKVTATEAAFIGLDGTDQDIYLNIHNPFCMLAIGLPGQGKSHTINCVLESCVLPNFNAKISMAALVCHFDKSGGAQSLCESAGLVRASHVFDGLCSPLPPSQLVVLCSPTNQRERERLYQQFVPGVRVLLLKFCWKDMRAEQIKKLMRLTESSNQLYVATMLEILRKHFEKDELPLFEDFKRELLTQCTLSQSGPVTQL